MRLEEFEDGEWVEITELKELHAAADISGQLLDALKEVEEWMGSGAATPTDGWGRLDRGAEADRQKVLAQVRDAIAKATGGKP